jgi:hypothetical protein
VIVAEPMRKFASAAAQAFRFTSSTLILGNAFGLRLQFYVWFMD